MQLSRFEESFFWITFPCGGFGITANYLRNSEHKDGGYVGLANNHSDELRYSCVRQVGGKSNLANSQVKPKRAAGGYDDLANKLLKSERVEERNKLNDDDAPEIIFVLIATLGLI